MEIDKEKIEQAIVESVADSMISDGDLEKRIKSAVDARIDSHFKASGDQQIQDAVNRAIKAGLEHEYCKVDSFGRKSGEPTTVSKELERIIAGYWNTRVDKNNGTPTDSSYSSISRAEYVMLKLVAADFSGEMKQHIVNLGASLKDSLRGELRSTLDRLLSEVFYVQSEGDRELGKPGRSCIDPAQTGKA
jgi:hypothetical protein